MQLREAAAILFKGSKKKFNARQDATWKPPPDTSIKINVDGSTRGTPGVSAIGGLGRSSSRDWLFGFAGRIDRGFAISAEIRVITYGLTSAWNKGFRNVLVESDSSQAIQFICRDMIPPSDLIPAIQECNDLINRNWTFEINYVVREANSCADILARIGHQFTMDIQDFDIPPPCLTVTLARDRLGLG